MLRWIANPTLRSVFGEPGIALAFLLLMGLIGPIGPIGHLSNWSDWSNKSKEPSWRASHLLKKRDSTSAVSTIF
jgi:hypothetical protein